MIHEETCLCNARTLRFESRFGTDVVTQLYCPKCVDRAPGDALIFEMCEPSLFAGHWGIKYNKGELARLDKDAFRDADDYYLSLLISRGVAPEMVGKYGEGGLCRILGHKYGPEEAGLGASLGGDAAHFQEHGDKENWPGDVSSGPKERRKGRPGKT